MIIEITGAMTIDPSRVLELRNAPATTERRDLPGAELRVEAGGDGKTSKITGYAAVYNTFSKPMKTSRGTAFRERIRPGAFGDLANADVMARYNHEVIIGRTKSGTLKLTADERGLKYEITPPDTAAATHAVESIRRGDVDGSSFAFHTIKDEWRMVDGIPTRDLVSVNLVDVGPVDQPAYGATAEGDHAVSLRAAGTDEAEVEQAIERLKKETRSGGGDERRYYYDPEASALTRAFRNGVENARGAFDQATLIIDQLEREKATFGSTETKAGQDLVAELERTLARCNECIAAVKGRLPAPPPSEDDAARSMQDAERRQRQLLASL